MDEHPCVDGAVLGFCAVCTNRGGYGEQGLAMPRAFDFIWISGQADEFCSSTPTHHGDLRSKLPGNSKLKELRGIGLVFL